MTGMEVWSCNFEILVERLTLTETVINRNHRPERGDERTTIAKSNDYRNDDGFRLGNVGIWLGAVLFVVLFLVATDKHNTRFAIEYKRYSDPTVDD